MTQTNALDALGFGSEITITKTSLLDYARRHFSQEISVKAAELANCPVGFFGELTTEQHEATAEILVSRQHHAQWWADIDSTDHAEMTAANADDM